jgi:hypothetical protein
MGCAGMPPEPAVFQAGFVDPAEGWELLKEPPENREYLLSQSDQFDRRKRFREAWFGIGTDKLIVCAYRYPNSHRCRDAGDYDVFHRTSSGWEQGDGTGLEHIMSCHEPIR